ncbi:hypothetical protein D3C86_1254420 [compost metagenome]
MEPEPERSGEDVANTQSQPERGLSIRTKSENAGLTCSCKDVADTYGESGLETSSPTSSIRSLRESRNNACGCCGKQSTGISGGAIKPELGGVLDGLSDWLDRHPWPAGQGAEQYDWEPPRVATGVKDRVGRLKALGNAVNPVQIYPILAAIKAIDDMMQ